MTDFFRRNVGHHPIPPQIYRPMPTFRVKPELVYQTIKVGGGGGTLAPEDHVWMTRQYAQNLSPRQDSWHQETTTATKAPEVACSAWPTLLL